ncbi:hypothetical protein RCL1_007032 [Eukaryota sp. TZLM3-RCL]
MFFDNVLKPYQRRRFLFIASTVGVYLSYLLYGIFQEKVTKTKYNGEKFKYYLFLVCSLCACNALVARILLTFTNIKLSRFPALPFLRISVTYVIAMLASNASLMWLTYPSQVLLKSCKMVPVLIAGVLIRRVKYHISKYVAVFLITSGIVIFMLKMGNKSSGTDINIIPGIILGIISLIFDGFTAVSQDSAVAKYDAPFLVLMYRTNIYGAFILFIFSVFSGESFLALGFISRNPTILLPFFGFALFSAVGQCFVFLLVTKFGSLLCTTVTTTRKFFTLLLSVVLFGNRITLIQWGAVLLVFSGISLEKIWKKKTFREKPFKNSPV